MAGRKVQKFGDIMMKQRLADESARLNANMMVQMDGMLDEILGEDVQ